MAQSSQLERLFEQRRLLVARSGELRSRMTGTLAELEASTVWLERGYTLVRASRSLWPILAGLAGLLLARRGGGLWAKTGKLFSWWRLARKLLGLWRSFRAQTT